MTKFTYVLMFIALFSFALETGSFMPSAEASEIIGNLGTGIETGLHGTVTGTAPAPAYAQASYGGGGGGGGDGSGSIGSTITQAKTQVSSITIKALKDAVKTQGDVLGASTFNFTRNLMLRMQGDDVAALQDFLSSNGYLNAASTGYFGMKTRSALAKWQAANKLPATGYFGALTRAKVNAMLASGAGSPLSVGATSTASTSIMVKHDTVKNSIGNIR